MTEVRPDAGDAVLAQVRAHGTPAAGRLTVVDGDRVQVELDEPLTAVAAGQTLALYSGSRVLGASTIA